MDTTLSVLGADKDTKDISKGEQLLRSVAMGDYSHKTREPCPCVSKPKK